MANFPPILVGTGGGSSDLAPINYAPDFFHAYSTTTMDCTDTYFGGVPPVVGESFLSIQPSIPADSGIWVISSIVSNQASFIQRSDSVAGSRIAKGAQIFSIKENAYFFCSNILDGSYNQLPFSTLGALGVAFNWDNLVSSRLVASSFGSIYIPFTTSVDHVRQLTSFIANSTIYDASFYRILDFSDTTIPVGNGSFQLVSAINGDLTLTLEQTDTLRVNNDSRIYTIKRVDSSTSICTFQMQAGYIFEGQVSSFTLGPLEAIRITLYGNHVYRM